MIADGVLTRAVTLALCLGLAACAGPARRSQDSTPPPRAGIEHTPDAVPRVEALSRGGNKSPYTVLGKTYTVMRDARGYQETGIASWYGMKFHGNNTSNGEVYDAYSMTAAHRSLPLPSYVRVTNLDNGRKVIVRVNDRGPFHDGRLIDLSYAAAYKLGFHEKGTARVRVESLDHAPPAAAVADARAKPDAPPTPGTYLQVGAFRSLAGAERLQRTLRGMFDQTVSIQSADAAGQAWYRVRIGPIADPLSLAAIQRQVNEARLGVPRVVVD